MLVIYAPLRLRVKNFKNYRVISIAGYLTKVLSGWGGQTENKEAAATTLNFCIFCLENGEHITPAVRLRIPEFL